MTDDAPATSARGVIDLGPRTSHHAWRARPDTVVWPVIFAVMFAAAGGFMMWLGQPLAIGFGVVALGFAGFMVMVFATSLRDRHDEIDLHTGGVIAKRRGVAHAWPWQELRFRFSATRYVDRGRIRLVNHHQLGAGDVAIPVDDDFPDVVALVGELETGIVGSQLVPAAQAIAAGDARRFGPLEITRDGLATALVKLAWSELASLDVAAGAVTIRRLGDGARIVIDYARLWNAALALVLIRAGIAGAFASSGPLRGGDVERHVNDVLARSAEDRIARR